MTLGAISGARRRTAAGTHISDNFNRADDPTSLGASWTARNDVLGILSNAAYPTNTGNVLCSASHNTAMAADDVALTWTAGTGSDTGTVLFLGANSFGVSAAALWISGGGYIFTVTDWVLGGLVTRGAAAFSFTTGDVNGFSRVGNVYLMTTNGTPTVGWTDSGNLLTRDSSHRLVGFGGQNLSGSYRAIDAFTADA